MGRPLLLAGLCLFFLPDQPALGQRRAPATRFEISFPASAHPEPITGRDYVMITRNGEREPRLQLSQVDGIPFFGKDVVALAPGAAAVIDDSDLGFPSAIEEP